MISFSISFPLLGKEISNVQKLRRFIRKRSKLEIGITGQIVR
jgi:hypothetical protein